MNDEQKDKAALGFALAIVALAICVMIAMVFL